MDSYSLPPIWPFLKFLGQVRVLFNKYLKTIACSCNVTCFLQCSIILALINLTFREYCGCTHHNTGTAGFHSLSSLLLHCFFCCSTRKPLSVSYCRWTTSECTPMAASPHTRITYARTSPSRRISNMNHPVSLWSITLAHINVYEWTLHRSYFSPSPIVLSIHITINNS